MKDYEDPSDRGVRGRAHEPPSASETRLGCRDIARCSRHGGAPSRYGPTTPKRGGTIRLAAQFPGKDPEPVTASNAGEVFTFQPSLEYLCYPREDWTLDPRLATAWKADPDPKTWTFTIRQGVKWHDGSMLTTDDVVATFQRLLDPNVGSSAGSVYHGVLSSRQCGEGQRHRRPFPSRQGLR